VASVGDKVRTHFDETAGEFDSIYTGEKGAVGRWLDRVLRWDMYERFRRTVAECGEPGLEVLDIGCGSGRFSVAVAKAGAARVVGLDFADGMLAIIGLFDYVAEPLPFLRKMCQVTRRKVVATFPLKWTWRAPVRKVRLALRGCPVYFFTKPQVERLMADAGFEPGAGTLRKPGQPRWCGFVLTPSALPRARSESDA